MPTPKIPQNQLNALPLIDVVAAANPGDIQIVGNTMTRFWSSTVLGGFANQGGGSILVSPALDFRGVSRFSLVVKRTFTVDTAVNLTAYLIYGFSDGSFPTTADIFAASPLEFIKFGGINLGLALPNPFFTFWTWADGTSGFTSPSAPTVGVGVAIGTNCKIAITNVVPVSANYTLLAELWGAQ